MPYHIPPNGSRLWNFFCKLAFYGEGSSLGDLEGKVGTQGMGLYGGAHQAYIDYRAVPADWIEITPATWKWGNYEQDWRQKA